LEKDGAFLSEIMQDMAVGEVPGLGKEPQPIFANFYTK